MKKPEAFSHAKRGAVVPIPKGKTRITIRIYDDVLDWFRGQVTSAGGGNYQTTMNTALREYVENKTASLEKTIRRVIREELRRQGAA